MSIRDAILKAADHIERNPCSFDFWNNRIPKHCGSPGCVLGWIGFFAGLKDDIGSAQLAVTSYLNTNPQIFYSDLHDLVGDSNAERGLPGNTERGFLAKHGLERGWKTNPSLAVEALRKYADWKFPISTPNWEEIASRRTVLPGEVSQEVEFS